MNTKNLAIMSTDIVGSSGTTAALNRKDYDLFRLKYDQIVTPLIEQASGEIFKSLGDGYLASFESSTNAVLAGLNIQSQLSALIAAFHLDQRFTTRIGIGSGDVTLANGDKFGVPVIHATRVQSIAEPTTTFITESVFLTMNRNEMAHEDLGYISLKGLEDKIRVFKATRKGHDLRREEMAVLCTDIRQFTEFGRHEEQIEQTLAKYDEVIFREALLHNGFFRYNLGDMYLITFKNVVDALEAAASISQQFSDLIEQNLIIDYRYQFGLDYGEVRHISGGLYGLSLSRVTPRLAEISNGEIVVSRTFWDKLANENELKAQQYKVTDEGEVMIKGTTKPLTYFALPTV